MVLVLAAAGAGLFGGQLVGGADESRAGGSAVPTDVSAIADRVMTQVADPAAASELPPAPNALSATNARPRTSTTATGGAASASPQSSLSAARVRGTLLAEYGQVYVTAQTLIGRLQGHSAITVALRAQQRALPKPAAAAVILEHASDAQMSQVDPSTITRLAGLTSPVYASVVSDTGKRAAGNLSGAGAPSGTAHVSPAQHARAISSGSSGTLLGVTPVAPAQDTPDEDCPDYPGGGLSPEDHQRALDGQDAIDVAVATAEGVDKGNPDTLIEGDEQLTNYTKYATALVVQALDLTQLAYNTTLEVAEVCKGNNTQNVAGDLLPDADSLYATGDTILSLDEQIAGLLDSRTQDIEAGVTQLQQVVDADNQVVQSAVGDAQKAGDELNASLTLRLRGAIERDLGASTTPVADFVLPASVGGYLDASPVGVRSVVHDVVNELDTAGVSYDPAALRDLAAGDSALSAGDDKTAYADYRAAYQVLSPVSDSTSAGG